MLEQRFFSLAACGEDHGESGCPPAVLRGPQLSRSPPAACRRPHARAVVCLKEAVTLWGPLGQAPGRTCGHVGRGAHAGADLLSGLVTLQGTHAGAACS